MWTFIARSLLGMAAWIVALLSLFVGAAVLLGPKPPPPPSAGPWEAMVIRIGILCIGELFVAFGLAAMFFAFMCWWGTGGGMDRWRARFYRHAQLALVLLLGALLLTAVVSVAARAWSGVP